LNLSLFPTYKIGHLINVIGIINVAPIAVLHQEGYQK
jgi:hypothetical protein